MATEDRPERRAARTTDTLVALARLFEAARRAGSFEALVLADQHGLPIAGAGAAGVCDRLAAESAVLSARPANDTVPCRMDVVTRTAKIRRLRIDGIEVLLCGEGEGGTRADPERESEALGKAAEGCRRILAEGRRGGWNPPREGGGPEGPSRLAAFGIAERSSAT